MQQLIHGDCVNALNTIADQYIDIVISDIPFGSTTIASWDVLHDNTNSALLGSSPANKTSSFKTRGKPINGWNLAELV